jgi:replicative superfamily II helicase
VIEVVAERVWNHPEFQREYRLLLRRNLQEYVRTESPREEVSEDEITRLLQSATHLAAVSQQDRKESAYRIASSAYGLFSATYGNSLRNLLHVIFGRLGIFPAINLLFKGVQIREDSIVGVVPGQGLSPRIWLEIASRAIDNEVEVAASRVLTLTDFQRRLWDALSNGKSATVTAPTSAGKSFALQFFLASQLIKQRDFIGLYIVPTRSLIHQVSVAIRGFLDELGGKDIPVLTIPQTPEDTRMESGIYVLTQERLQILLETDPAIRFSLVVVDEAQTMASDSRGVILQTVIDQLRERLPETQFLFSSPPVSNPDLFGSMFGLGGVPPPIEELETPVAQNIIYLTTSDTNRDQVKIEAVIANERIAIGTARTGVEMLQRPQTLATLSWYFGREDQSLVYVGSQAAAEEVASFIAQLREPQMATAAQAVREELSDFSTFLREHVHRDYILAETVKNGVAFHYGQMPAVVRQAIEDQFDEGLIRHLVSTSTLLHGVNLPAKNLFILDPTSGGEWNTANADPISGPEFWNLAGRAGRLGKEFEGNVFLVNHASWKADQLNQPKKQPIQPALDCQVKDKKSDLLKFIGDTSHASGKDETQGTESAFMRLFNEARKGTLATTLSRVCGDDNTTIAEITAAINAVVPEVTLPTTLTERHITISALRQQEMYESLKKKVEDNGPDDYIPPHPSVEWAIAYAKMHRLIRRIHSNFEKLPGKDKSQFYFASLALLWMRGEPLPQLIDSAIKYAKGQQVKKAKEKAEAREAEGKTVKKKEISVNTASIIRGVMSNIENDLRFRYVKYISCYSDILRIVLRETGNTASLESIPSLPLYLELGACSGTMVSLITLGLSRTAAGIIARKAAIQNMTPSAAEDWLLKFNLEAAGVPGICIREVEKIWGTR